MSLLLRRASLVSLPVIPRVEEDYCYEAGKARNEIVESYKNELCDGEKFRSSIGLAPDNLLVIMNGPT